MENENSAPNPNNALSIYGQNDAAMEDFPVLKAFQQYIDAEQSKSRKRMIMLCMFFGVLMTVLVAAFMLVISQMNRGNESALEQMNRDKQSANDQLIQFLMKERERPQTTVQPTVVANPANDAALKAVTETLASLQKQIADQKRADEDSAARAATKAEIEEERRQEREAAKLRQQKAELEEAKRKLADEKERLRQQEIERQRRRLYPDYYAKQEGGSTPSPAVQAPSPAPAKQPRKIEYTDEDVDDILREVDSLRKADEAKAKKASAPKPKEKKSAPAKKSDGKKKDGEKAERPHEYFNDTEYSVPVKVNGEEAGFSIPLE